MTKSVPVSVKRRESGREKELSVCGGLHIPFPYDKIALAVRPGRDTVTADGSLL